MNVDITNFINNYGIFNTLGIAGLIIYLFPILVNFLLSILRSTVAFILRITFFDNIERAIKKYINGFISRILQSDDVTTNDIPHLESDYLFLYRIKIVKNGLIVEIPTVEIRIRFWRVISLVCWFYVKTHICFWKPAAEKRLSFDNALRALCSKEIKEIKLQNAIVDYTYEQREVKTKQKSSEIEVEQIIEEAKLLNDLDFHVLLERFTVNVHYAGETFIVENTTGHIHHAAGVSKVYLFGFHNGQVVSLTNVEGRANEFRAMVTNFLVTKEWWQVITKNIPGLRMIHNVDEEDLCKISDLNCCFKIARKVTINNISWRITDGEAYYEAEKQQYDLQAVEGSFRIDKLQNFYVHSLKLKLNNHPLSAGGYVSFGQPVTSQDTVKHNKGSFKLTIDDNKLSFMSNLHVGIIGRLNLSGDFVLDGEKFALTLQSGGKNKEAVAVQYKDYSITLNDFSCSFEINDNQLVGKEIKCAVLPKGSLEEANDKASMCLQDFNFDLATQRFSLQAELSDYNTYSLWEKKKFSCRADLTMFIEGCLSTANSVVARGKYNLYDLQHSNILIQHIIPENIKGDIIIDGDGLRIDAKLNDSLALPCYYGGGSLRFKAPVLPEKVSDVAETVKSMTEAVKEKLPFCGEGKGSILETVKEKLKFWSKGHKK